MDKFLLILSGGSFVGLMGIISVSAISMGFIFQGAMVGALGLMMAAAFLYILAIE